MKKIILISFCFVFLLSLATACNEISYSFTQGEPVNIKLPCVDSNNDVCPDTISCQITSTHLLSGLDVVKNQSMDYNYNYVNYTFNSSQMDLVGNYQATVNCRGDSNSFSTFCYRVTQTGEIPTSSEGMIYLVLIVISCATLALVLFIGFGIDGSNYKSDVMGVLEGVNWRKYYKFGLWFIAYALAVWVSFLCYSTAESFLTSNPIITFFEMIFYILLSLGVPFAIGFTWMFFASLVKDVADQKLFDRGLSPR